MVAERQRQIDHNELIIQQLTKKNEQQAVDIQMLTAQRNEFESQVKTLEDEAELKSHENNKLRQACADIEKAMQDLYRSRKGPGSLQIEMDSLKIDNDCLLQLLKETCEYAEFSNDEIMKAAST
jgi:uncharacterized protein YoxC